MNILFSVNKGYLVHLRECIFSISQFDTDGGYELYILHTDLEESDKQELEAGFDKTKLHLHYILADSSKTAAFPQTERYPAEIYYRIYAKELLPDTMDRVLYLDADLIVIKPLDELYNMPFDNHYYLACTHIQKLLNKVNAIRLGIDGDYAYINSGVMLINLKLLRKEQDLSEVADYVAKHKDALILPDQDIISALYGERVGLLDTLRYNLSDRIIRLNNSKPGNVRIDLDWVRENAVIIHYFGKAKPWKAHYIGILDVFYRENKARLEAITTCKAAGV